MDLQSFLHMGGYAAYVWPAYGITALVMVANVFAARRRLATMRAELDRRRLAAGNRT
jgi:heme exporter protein D